ncbi:nucleoid-associated protein [Sansalvadorimonas sp. 2012CJ34-2]|uniref:Nucleoid-associated protein n=1 Tax=Parendozoicomonas callyspongiae TaxID=2942213 RepID=A0ABT0PG77_9GAMM|nr:nucleoid-associated protein [Sansalvadorimonas sp. 2012CJ34-2]MCL6270360.1 nucleoid-associated protein [Sansalvadorimonas sp. 2012CJ34-2]
MSINNLIVHRIERRPDAESSELRTRATPLDSNNTSEAFLEDLIAAYNKKGDKGHGSFGGEATEFRSQLEDYLEERLSFTDFSLTVAEGLKSKLDEAGMFPGGFILVAHYTSGLTSYLLVGTLPPATSTTVTEQLELSDTTYLDLARLSLAARINLTEWQGHQNSARYISWIKPRAGRRLSDCLTTFLGCEENGDTKNDTKQLMSAVSDYCKTIDEDGTKNTVKKKVFEYCDNQLQEYNAISLDELSAHISEESPDSFARFVNTRDYDVSPDIQPSRSQLKKLVRYSGRDKGINIAFDSDVLGTRIQYDRERDTITIVGIPDSLKKQLEEEAASVS